MKHVIIPTDLSIRSLQPIHDVVRYYESDQVDITLLHLLEMPSSVGDLLFRLHRFDKLFPVPVPFRNALEVISGRYERRLGRVRTALEYGSSARLVRNLLEGLRADVVFMHDNTPFQPPFRESVDMKPLLWKCGVEVITSQAVAPAEHPSTLGDLLVVERPAPVLETY